MRKCAIVFLAWGEQYIREVEACINESVFLSNYDIFLITDDKSLIKENRINIIRASFSSKGLIRKTELFDFLPDEYDIFLFLDSDTRVIDDISFGFECADSFGVAVSPAPHYSLDYFFGFDKVMELENLKRKGQLQYNTGVIFFKNTPQVKKLFSRWRELADKYQGIINNDQPFFTLALEQLQFNPYTLSISYNYRGFGDAISGVVRVWHSHNPIPKNINEFEKAWPPRRVISGKVIPPESW